MTKHEALTEKNYSQLVDWPLPLLCCPDELSEGRDC